MFLEELAMYLTPADLSEASKKPIDIAVEYLERLVLDRKTEKILKEIEKTQHELIKMDIRIQTNIKKLKNK